MLERNLYGVIDEIAQNAATAGDRTDFEKKKIRSIVNFISFTEGLTHLSSLAVFYSMKDDLKLDPHEVSLMYFLPSLPWLVKPVLALLADTYPIFGERRRPYIIFSALFQATGYLILASKYAHNINGTSVALLIVSTASAVCSASSEALVMEVSSGEHADNSTRNITHYISSKAIGSLIVSYWSGYLLEYFSKQSIFFVTALFPIIVAILALWVDESPRNQGIQMSLKERLSVSLSIITQPFLLYPILFIFIYMVGPDYDDAFFFFLVNRLKFQPAFMGKLKLSYGIAALVGANVFNLYLRTVPTKKVLVYTVILGLPFYLSPIVLIYRWNLILHINDEFFLIGGGFISEAISEVQLLPLLVLASRVCPPTLEATMFSIVVSVRHFGAALRRVMSALMITAFGVNKYNFQKLDQLILMCGVFSMVPLVLSHKLPTQTATKIATDDFRTRFSMGSDPASPLPVDDSSQYGTAI